MSSCPNLAAQASGVERRRPSRAVRSAPAAIHAVILDRKQRGILPPTDAPNSQLLGRDHIEQVPSDSRIAADSEPRPLGLGRLSQLRPLLGAVQNADDEDDVAPNEIDQDVGQRSKHQLARACAFSRTAAIRKRQERGGRVIDGPYQFRRPGSRVEQKVVGNLLEIR